MRSSRLLGVVGVTLVAWMGSARADNVNDTNNEALLAAHLSFEIPFALQGPSAVPQGLEGDATLPPYNLVFGWHPLPGKHAVFVIDANATFPRYSMIPALGVTPGMAFKIHDEVQLGFAVDIQDQQTVAKAPFKSSQFDTWIVSLMANVRFSPLPWLMLGMDLRYAAFLKTQLAKFEGLETDIDHQNSFFTSPWAEIKLPFEFKFRGQLDMDELGATAIASKDFAVGINRQTVERLGVSLSRQFGEIGINLHYYYVTGYNDAIELAYQAPFYYRDYLLSPQTLTLGVTWNF